MSFFKYVERYYQQLQSDFVETNKELHQKVQLTIKTNPGKDHGPLVTKLSHIYSDIHDLNDRMEMLIAEIDQENSISLSERDIQRVEQYTDTQKMFSEFLPYFFLYKQEREKKSK